MRRSKIVAVLMVLALIVSLVGAGSSYAQDGPGKFKATALTPESVDNATPVDKAKPNGVSKAAPLAATARGEQMVSVIVKLDVDSVASYQGDIPGLPATSPSTTGSTQLDLNSPNVQRYQAYVDNVQKDFETNATKAIAGAQVTNRYDLVLGGVSMVVPANQVDAVAKLPGVKAVYPDALLHLETDNSPQFIGAPTAWQQLGGQESAGENVIVGMLDTGIWPEHPSFSDPDPSGKPYAPPPPPLSGTRACQFSGGTNPGAPFTCNNKLIGANRFMSTYDAVIGLGPGEFTSARDDDGHGTHTSSTAAGNAGVAASIFGISRGIVSGIAPRAHVIMYKVCGAEGCFNSDSAAAVQQAIKDGVNVINFSISGGANPYSDAVELAFLQAYDAGVFVAASAGNSGPGADTTDHRGPWVTTVAASTQNRAFENTATITADGGDSLVLHGASLTAGVGPAPVVVPATDPQCNNPFAAGSVAGKIVVCQRGVSGRAQKGFNVLQGGAVGMILYNQSTSVTDLETDNHFLPATHIQFNDGTALLNFISSHTNVQATLSQGVKVPAQGDVMASFSSRGGPGQSLGVSKPDITAPGVQILAGASPQHVDVASGPQGELFQAIAGTSMSSPHIAGAGALIKALHPDWTPGKIKSALMTTAWTQVVKEDGVTPATPFDDGSGRVDLSKAGNVGLTFDETAADYVALQDQLWNANYPSVYVPVMPGIVSVKRTAHSELRYFSCWKTSVDSPADVSVFVLPVICVRPGGDETFSIVIDGHQVPLGEVRHATLKLKFGLQQIHLPISFVRQQPVVTLDKTCAPAMFPKGSQTTCSITMTNTSFSTATVNLTDFVPNPLKVVNVQGANAFGNFVYFKGALAGAEPPDVMVGTGSSPAGGYLPLSAFGVAPVSGMGDETIANFNVPAFQYAGEIYTRLGVVSDGYLVVGGGTGADVQFINQNLPDAARPNNVLAPFWTDLNPGASGAVRVGTLTDGVNTWLVVDFDKVPNFSGGANVFEVWIRLGTVEDITFTYGSSLTTGEGGSLTIGAENRFGNRGANFYYNGTGTFPGANFDAVVVSSTPPAPGETHVITVTAKGDKKGNWTNCAEMKGDIFFGTNVACFSGQVTK